MDVIALSEAGFATAVAPLGTALTEDQLTLLWRVSPEPILAFDGDDAGRRAAQRASRLALPHLVAGQSLSFVFLPAGEDPDSFLRRPAPSRCGRSSIRPSLWPIRCGTRRPRTRISPPRSGGRGSRRRLRPSPNPSGTRRSRIITGGTSRTVSSRPSSSASGRHPGHRPVSAPARELPRASGRLWAPGRAPARPGHRVGGGKTQPACGEFALGRQEPDRAPADRAPALGPPPGGAVFRSFGVAVAGRPPA